MVTAQKYVRSENSITFEPTNQTRMARLVRYFDRETCEFVGQKKLIPVNEDYLRKIFELDVGNPMLFSYPVNRSQQEFIERFTGLKMNLQKYQYFLECDFQNTTS
ncbi:DUF7683 domain-containing protein [Aliikangiella sp. IMCC44359]|uniref:DUF7683 domain-containing protein n=1 Tax=Aliikangiella sp. IMCC44359 TaxID=3459125 RepID=UPI00403A9653